MLGKIIDKALSYLSAKLDLLKLSIIERVSLILGFFMFMMVSMIMVMAAMVFLGIGLSEYFAAITNSVPLGYLIVSGIYILLLVFIFIFKKTLSKWFAGLFVNLLTGEDEEEPENPNHG